jgi:hypothetical protein
MPQFLSNKPFINPKSKTFLYHGTDKNPNDFTLRDEYEWEDSHVWGGDLPNGTLFLTTSIKEASAYGRYVIPVELRRNDSLIFKLDVDNPSQIFDDDYGISVVNKYAKYGQYSFWDKFENSGKSNLVLKGTDKSTVITYTDNVIPRIDLAKVFYSI